MFKSSTVSIVFLVFFLGHFCAMAQVNNETGQINLFENKTNGIDSVEIYYQEFQLRKMLKKIDEIEPSIPRNSFDRGLLCFFTSSLFLELNEMQLADEESKKLMEIINEITDEDQRVILQCYYLLDKINTLGIYEQNEPRMAFAKQMFELIDHVEKKDAIYHTLKGQSANILANFLIKAKDFSQAQDYLEIAKQHYDVAKIDYNYIRYFRTMGYWESVNKSKDFVTRKRKALTYYDQMLFYATKANCINSLYYVYPMVSSTYGSLGDLKQESKYLSRFKVLNDQINKEKLETKRYLEKLEREERDRSRKMLIFIAILLLCVFFAVGIVIFRKVRDRYYDLKLTAEELDSYKSNILSKDEPSSEVLEHLVQLSKENENAFYVQFLDVFPIFYQRLNELEPSLSESEVKFLMYIKMNYSTKEIAEYTNTTVKSVEGRKYRIRKKLQLDKDNVSIYNFVNQL